MTPFPAPPDTRPAHRSFRLTRSTPSVAVASQVRPAMVLAEQQARVLLTAAERADVSRGGCLSAGPAGIQVWSGPWDGVLGTHGSSQHLGSVDWCYDTPTRHYITVYRVMVTVRGVAAGQTTTGLLARVLSMAGIDPGAAGALPMPPPRDPFRARAVRDRTEGADGSTS